MKRLFILLTFFYFTESSFAQNDFRFADSTAYWTQCHKVFWEGVGGTWATYHTNIYIVEGDTFFNNFNYQIISPGFVADSAFVRRDSTGKVFLYDLELQSDRMIYDYGLIQGDTLRLYRPTYSLGNEDTIKFVVDSTDSVTLGKVRKRMYMRCVTGYYCDWFTNDIIIEGIGTLNSHFLSPYSYEFIFIPGDAFNLLYFEENGITYNFSSGCTVGVSEISADEIKVYPNPANEEIKITLQNTNHRIESVAMYEVTGKVVSSNNTPQPPSRGDSSALIDVSGLTKGLYFLHVEMSNGNRVVRKIIKE